MTVLTKDGDYVSSKAITWIQLPKMQKATGGKSGDRTYWTFLFRTGYHSYSSPEFEDEELAMKSFKEIVLYM